MAGTSKTRNRAAGRALNKGSTARAAGRARKGGGGRRVRADGATSFHLKHSKVSRGLKSGASGKNSITRSGAAASHIDYILRDGAADQVGEQPSVLSNISQDVGEIRSFFRAVEDTERKGGIVQNRLIAELPHELTPEQQMAPVRAFAQEFEDRNLRYVAVIHAPGAGSDKRNYHLHLDYYERPTERDDSGRWDFQRGQKQKKLREVSHKTWIGKLRRSYCATMNNTLARAGEAKRHFHESYQAAGLGPAQETHMGIWKKGRMIGERAFNDAISGLTPAEQKRRKAERRKKRVRGMVDRANDTLGNLLHLSRMTREQRNLEQRLARRIRRGEALLKLNDRYLGPDGNIATTPYDRAFGPDGQFRPPETAPSRREVERELRRIMDQSGYEPSKGNGRGGRGREREL